MQIVWHGQPALTAGSTMIVIDPFDADALRPGLVPFNYPPIPSPAGLLLVTPERPDHNATDWWRRGT